jgi:predicted amidohydrolase
MKEIRVGSIQPVARLTAPRPRGEPPERPLVGRKIEENLDLACSLLARAGEAGCDAVVYPEDIQAIGDYLYCTDLDLFSSCVETIPGPTTDRVSEVARKHRMHVVFTMYERIGEAVYNAAVLMGRTGEVIGKYHKVQLPGTERWIVTPGSSFPVFETDFGTVGMMICYDIAFPEVARCLALNGAEVLFHSTNGYHVPGERQGNGLLRVRMRAIDNFVPIVVAACGRDSAIVNSDGTVLAMGRPGREDVLVATLDLEAMPEDHSEWELITGLADLKGRLLQERRAETFSPLVSPHPAVLERYRDRPLRSPPEEHGEFIAEVYRWWAERG